jgi:hypothetical protein
MREGQFRRFMAWTIVVGLMAQFIGCYTFQQVENWKEYPENKIRITSKGGTSYKLGQWQVASSGDITAEGVIHDPRWYDDSSVEQFIPFHGTIPADSIARVEVWKRDVLVTAAVALGSAGILTIAYDHWRTHFLENLDLGWGRKK